MDTEEAIEIKEATRKGHSQTDEGPYYHESWWEAYKGSVKGKLGGVVIGAAVGAVVGLAVAAVVAAAGLEIAALTVILGFSAGGMIYGAHEFSEVGKVTGAVAAAHEKSEERMKSFENGKFAEIKQEISELKQLVGGGKAVAATKPKIAKEVAPEHAETYRTQHCDDHCPPEKRQLVFWNIAAIGLAVGATAGALLAGGGFDSTIVEHLGGAGHALEGAGHLATVASLGLFGASFGINRDMFRQVFDKTDLLFKGIVKGGKGLVIEPQHSAGLATAPCADKCEEKVNPNITTISQLSYPPSETHHRDRVLASAKLALLSMDHTKSISH